MQVVFCVCVSVLGLIKIVDVLDSESDLSALNEKIFCIVFNVPNFWLWVYGWRV